MNRFTTRGLKTRSFNRFLEAGAEVDPDPTKSQYWRGEKAPENYSLPHPIENPNDKTPKFTAQQDWDSKRAAGNAKAKAYYDQAAIGNGINSSGEALGPIASAIEKMISGSLAGVTAFWAAIKSFGISTFGGLATKLMNWADSASKAGGVSGFFGSAMIKIHDAVASATDWVSTNVSKMYDAAGMNTKFPGLSVSVGQVLAFALLAAAVLFILYKIYKAVKNKMSESVSNNREQLIAIKRGIYESQVMFKKLKNLTESTSAAASASEGMLSKAGDMALEMWDWIKGKVSAGYTTVSKLVHDHPYICLMILVCIGCVIAYLYFSSGSDTGVVSNVGAGDGINFGKDGSTYEYVTDPVTGLKTPKLVGAGDAGANISAVHNDATNAYNDLAAEYDDARAGFEAAKRMGDKKMMLNAINTMKGIEKQMFDIKQTGAPIAY